MNDNARDNAVYWLWLQHRLGIPSRVVSAALALEGGARRVYESASDELWELGLFAAKSIGALKNRDLTAARRILKNALDLGMEVVTPDMPEYPSRLRTLPDPPAALFVKGKLPPTGSLPCIAIVGTRSATEYGAAAARELSRRLTRAGALVVSGCARGIDTAAHEGALEAGGRTLAVLGCGIDCRYNAANALLRERIAANGALLSEYPPGAEAIPRHFPVRNRIISGICLGTVVMEADAKSGSLITADLALEQGRDVFAVPPGVGSPNSTGIQRLLADGASPVCSPLDVLKEYAAMYPHALSLAGTERPLMYGREPQPDSIERQSDIYSAERPQPPPEPKAPPLPERAALPEGVSPRAAALYEHLRSKPKLADALAAEADIEPPEALALLTELELFGAAKAHPGGRYSLG